MGVYRGKSLKHVLMPLGGLGTGTIGLSGSGELREWAVFNRPGGRSLVKNSFFGIWARRGKAPPVYRVLQKETTDYPYIRMGNIFLFHVEDVVFRGEYPIARLDYADDELPVRVSLEAFSPCIPLETENSALPAVVFRFSVRNPYRETVSFSVVGSLLNAVGYDGQEEIYWGWFNGARGNFNRLVREPGWTAIHCCSARLPEDAEYFGTMSLATTARDVSWKSRCLYPPDEYFDLLMRTGRLPDEEDESPVSDGFTPAGMLAAHGRLLPGEERTSDFLLTWRFPNRSAYWQAGSPRVGNRYCVRFKDSLDVIAYVSENLDCLRSKTAGFRDALFSSTVPASVKEVVSCTMVIPRTSTCFQTEDGTFCGFEGSRSHDGSCPLNCTHVWGYEQTLAHLFPDLERNMRETDLFTLTGPEGMVRHRLILPRFAVQTHGPVTDGQFGTVLKTYREYLLSGDGVFLRKAWPVLKRVMEYAFTTWDPDRRGVMDGVRQSNTYDLDLVGINPFTGTLYLAALKAMETMAVLVGDADAARMYRGVFQSGSGQLDRETFDGEYFVQKCLPGQATDLQFGTGCLSDQLIGQWWANILGLGHLLPAEHIHSALRSVYRYNFRSMRGLRHFQRVFADVSDRGLVVCSWPKGGRPAKPMFYCDEVWTGVEYEVASLMIQEGMVEEGLQIVAAARKRQDGTRRNPYNDCEAGSYYARAMSSWTVLTALSGFSCDMGRGCLAFHPRVHPSAFRSFFSTGTGWGVFSQEKEGTSRLFRLKLCGGRILLRSLALDIPRGTRHATLRKENQGVSAVLTRKGKQTVLEFPEGVSLSAGETLLVRAGNEGRGR